MGMASFSCDSSANLGHLTENSLHYTTVHGAPPIDHLSDDMTTNNFDALQNIPHEQWWAEDASAFPLTSGGLDPAIYYHQGDLPYNHFNPNFASEWQGLSSMQEYAAPSASDSSYLEPSPSVSSRRSSASTQQDDKRRKQSTAERSTSKSTKRSPSTRKNKPQATTVEGKKEPKSRKAQPSKTTTSGSSPEDVDEYSKRVQERNRVASNKFRIKKREDAKKLKTDEEDMERINRDLSSCVADLTLEVYQLKMRLLQHTDCDCALIQNYIANEAQRYIRNLDDEHAS